MELGIDRLLTSGQAASASQGAARIRDLARRAGTAIAIMPGGGIRPSDVAALVRATGVREVHASASEFVATGATDAFGIMEKSPGTNPATVRALVAALREVSSHDRSA